MICPLKPLPKLNKENFENIEHQLKSKLVWPVGTAYEVKIKNGAGAMKTKNEVFIGL